MDLEEKIKIIREARNQVRGDITIQKYRKIKNDNGWPILRKLLGQLKWNELKNKAFEEDYEIVKSWTVEDAKENYKKAQRYFGKSKIVAREYNEFVEEFSGPSISFITDRWKWNEFRRMLGVKGLEEYKEILNPEKEMIGFCDVCLEKENCDIKLENCQYWKEWQNENRSANSY